MSWSVLLMQVMEKWEASEHLGASSRSLTLERRLAKTGRIWLQSFC